MKESILAKQEEVKLVSEKMKNSAAFVVFKYQGLTVKAFQTLRRAMREAGVEVSVIKNNITTRAAKDNGYDAVVDAFTGAFAKEDVVAPAKILFAAKKEEETSKLEVVKGVVDGDVYSFDQLQVLSQLPSYETLLTQLAAGMLGTVSQLAIGLNMLVEKGQEA